MPTAEVFSEHMCKMRVHRDDQIVCYSYMGLVEAARVSWMLRYFGASNVRIMDGGFHKWNQEKRSTPIVGAFMPGQGLSEQGDYGFEVVDENKKIKDVDQVHHIAYYLANKATDWQIIDTRPESLFLAKGPGDRPGHRQGHIMGSVNIPFQKFIDAKTGCLK